MWSIIGLIILFCILVAFVRAYSRILLETAAVLIIAGILIGIVSLIAIGLYNPESRAITATVLGLAYLCYSVAVIRKWGLAITLKGLLVSLTPAFSVKGRASKELKLEALARERGGRIREWKEYYREKTIKNLERVEQSLKKKFRKYPAFDIERVGLILTGHLESGKEPLFTVKGLVDYPSTKTIKFSVKNLVNSNSKEVFEVYEIVSALKPIVMRALIEKEKAKVVLDQAPKVDC
jgi:hypothetical protein